MTKIVQFSISNRKVLKGKVLVCHFPSHGSISPFWEARTSNANISALSSLSIILSCKGNTQFFAYQELGDWIAQKASAWFSQVKPFLAILHRQISASVCWCPFTAEKETELLISVNQVQIYSFTFTARKQRPDSLSKLLCSPHWNLHGALFPGSPFCDSHEEILCNLLRMVSGEQNIKHTGFSWDKEP